MNNIDLMFQLMNLSQSKFMSRVVTLLRNFLMKLPPELGKAIWGTFTIDPTFGLSGR